MSNSNDPKSILAKYRAKVAGNLAPSGEAAQNGQSNESMQNVQPKIAEKNGQTNKVATGLQNKKGTPKNSALKNASALEKQKQQAVKMFDQLSQRSDDVNASYFKKLAEVGNMPDSKKTKKALDKVIAEFAPQFAELENGFRDLDALLTSIDNAQWVDG